MRGANKFQQMTESISWHSSKPCRQIKETSESTIQAKSLFRCHTAACGIKGKQKKHMHVLYTNHMYPSSVVSNVNVKRKHPSWCLYTKHKNIFKKNNSIFHCHFIRLLFAQCAWCHRLSPTGAYGYIHVCAQYLIKVNATTPECNAWKMVKDSDWTNFHVLFDSGLSHLVSQCSSIWNKNYRQINKTIPNIIPATFQTNTRTGPHLPCDTCRCHTRWGSYSWVQLVFGLKGIQVRD